MCVKLVLVFAVQESKLKASRMHIYVRRGGPNYQTGLAKMRALGEELGVPLEVLHDCLLPNPHLHPSHSRKKKKRTKKIKKLKKKKVRYKSIRHLLIAITYSAYSLAIFDDQKL